MFSSLYQAYLRKYFVHQYLTAKVLYHIEVLSIYPETQSFSISGIPL